MHFSLIQILLIIGGVEPHPWPDNDKLVSDIKEYQYQYRVSLIIKIQVRLLQLD
jgi:hypothetical protein